MAGWAYGSAADTPVSGNNYMLTKEYWEDTVLHESWNETLFSDLMSEEGGGGMIIFNAEQLRKGGKQSTIQMRKLPAEGTKPVKGNTPVVNYGTPSSSLTDDMTFTKMQVYAGLERFAWQVIGKESVRMVYQLDVINESASFVADLHKQRKEEAVIHTLIFGYSQSVTRVVGKGSGDHVSGHMKKVPNSFSRNGAAGSAGGYNIDKLPHPNTYWLDEAQFTTTIINAGVAADVNFDTITNVMDSELDATEGIFTVAAILRMGTLAVAHKIKKVSTPFGFRWLWFVSPECGADIRSALLTYQKDAGPRDYASNRLWSGMIGDFGGFLFLESEYLKTMHELISQESLTGATGYDDGAGSGNMAIAITSSTAPYIYPTLVCGEGALGYAEPEGMSADEELLDLGAWYIRGAGHIYGYRRADWYTDNGTDYFATAGVADVVSGASVSGTPVVWNYSSMLVMAKSSSTRA